MDTMGLIDPAALSRWFDVYGAALVLYARQWLSTDAAEDVVQEVFVRLLSQGRAPDHVKSWLFRSVRNAAIGRVRSQKRRCKYEGQRAADRQAWFEGRPDDLLDAAAAQSALLALPDEQREVIVLRIWAGMTLQEASQVTGQPVSTLFSRYRAGLAALRETMETSCKTQKD